MPDRSVSRGLVVVEERVGVEASDVATVGRTDGIRAGDFLARPIPDEEMAVGLVEAIEIPRLALCPQRRGGNVSSRSRPISGSTAGRSAARAQNTWKAPLSISKRAESPRCLRRSPWQSLG